MDTDTTPPWAIVPSELADAFRPHVDDLTTEMVAEIQRRVPEYARADPAYGQTLLTAVDICLRHFLDLVADPQSPWQPVEEFYEAIGRGEAGEGRSLDACQTALRVGAWTAWRKLAAHCEREDIPQRTMGLLAEGFFEYIDRIATATAAGHARAMMESADEMARHRRRLLDLILTSSGMSFPAVEELARLARWRLPRTAAVVVFDEHGGPHATLPPEVLTDFARDLPCALIPDPDGPGRRSALGTVLRGRTAVIGPSMPLDGAAKSLGWATETMALVRRRIIRADGLIPAIDHVTTLITFKDEDLVAAVSERRLAPLQEVRPAHREQLARTLLACLQNGFNATEAATRLHVHPQTVRYRLQQLQRLFRDRLDDPNARLELEIVLHAWLARPRESDAKATT
ncbi:PucR family transcriptional regulator [Actinomadura craniellae]|uniref:PucR family transcriptional regulator n=1 Tax=Actinomadura craniellae TaxID=2231787 RepID=A0A365GWN1_9ACTN|nr:helix-turn-helix domain-containing protein [Actinomadura craniellae]RAY11237.1 PucR family transcriptional regulator [Actinomadura craniellae]